MREGGCYISTNPSRQSRWWYVAFTCPVMDECCVGIANATEEVMEKDDE